MPEDSDHKETVSLKEYVDLQAEMNRKLFQVQFENIENNVAKANSTMDRRLDGMNEFRQTLKDANSTFITRKELFAWIVALLSIFFAYSQYRVNQNKETPGQNIVSGDKVEVKK